MSELLAKYFLKKMKFWIKERRNPQLGTYYVAEGKMSKVAAKKHENCLYGDNIMHSFDREEEYEAKLEELRKNGETLQ